MLSKFGKFFGIGKNSQPVQESQLGSKLNTFSQPAVAKNGNSVVVMGKQVSNLETQEESIRNNTRAAQTTSGLKSTNSSVNGGSRRRKRRKSIRRKKRFV
jgi:hypothetical protein